MKKIIAIFFVIYLILSGNLLANETKTLPLAYLDIDGIHAASNGVIYAAGGFNGDQVYYITPTGVTYDFASGLNGPIDITDDGAGNLYVTNFNSATVSRISRFGEVTQFAEVLDGPAGIVRDSQGNLFVSHYGVGNGTGDTILKISPDGIVSTFAKGEGLNAPVGTAIDDKDNLYVANFNDGTIYRFSPEGQSQRIAQIESNVGFAIGHLTFANGKLFATGPASNSVYVVSKDGTVKLRKNLGEGQFPNGIAFDPASSSLLVAKAFTPIPSLFKVPIK